LPGVPFQAFGFGIPYHLREKANADARADRAEEDCMKTYLHGIWENRLVSLVRMQDTITSIENVKEFMGSFNQLSSEQQTQFMLDNFNAFVDVYLLIEMIIRDEDARIEERAALLNAKR